MSDLSLTLFGNNNRALFTVKNPVTVASGTFGFGSEFKEYISLNLEADDRDYIYFMNMEGHNKFIEKDYGHKFITTFETDVVWLYNLFSGLYQLTNTPLFSLEYRMDINRYDYYRIVSPEPYDLFMLTSKLTLDLHKNIQGGISGSLAIENFRNRVDNDINREVFSYEIVGNISFIF